MLGQAHCTLLRQGALEMAVPEQPVAQTDAALRNRSEGGYLNRCRRARDADHCIVDRLGHTKCGRGTDESVVSHHGDRGRLSIGKRHEQRYQAIVRKVCVRDYRISGKENSVLLKLNRSEMWPKQ